jgi:hypothetical protein
MEKLKYQTLLEEFLMAREWEDELEVDAENGVTSLRTRLNLGVQTARLTVTASDRSDLLDVLIHFDIKCRPDKHEQMAVLCNALHERMNYGRFQVSEDSFILWFHRVDFEGSTPTALSINNIVGPGWDLAKNFGEVIAAVALTRQSAAEALQEYDEAKKSDEVPEEL